MPEVEDVTVSIPLVGRKPVIGLSLVPAQFLLSMPGGKAYILGENGVVLADARKVGQKKQLGLQLLQEDVPLEVSVGHVIMTATDIAFLNTVTSELKKANLEVSRLQLPVGAGELHVHLKTEPYIIKFAFNGDARQQVGAFLALKSQLSSTPPSSYVDVRIGERVYIK